MMYDALMKIMENSLNIMGKMGICVVLFQLGIKRIWPKYPLPGFKGGFFLFVALLGIYGFIRGLITGW